MANKKMNLQEQAEKILQQAEEKGVASNFFFVTTFKRYQVQMPAPVDAFSLCLLAVKLWNH